MKFTVRQTYAAPEFLIKNGMVVMARLFRPDAWPPVNSTPVLPAIVDTGSAVTCVAESHLLSLGLRHHLERPFMTLTEPKVLRVYKVGLELTGHPGGDPYRQLYQPVVAVSAFHNAYIAIIGRDLLKHATIVYDGPNKQFTLEMNW